jgi:tRNA modification GTPase
MGGIGVVRISGPRALEIAGAMTATRLAPRHARYCRFRDPHGATVDAGIALYFAGPHSFTGEDVVELQGHGGPVVLGLVLDAALARGARMARPGEFTERAFLNGKLDLAQAEAVADLIASGSAAAARGAMRSLEGDFSAAVGRIDQAILGLRIFVEAAMDFPEEAVEFLAEGEVGTRLEEISDQIAALLRDTRQGVLLRDGIQIALIGVPNVGKSSLLNRLAGQERAIVSDIPGTTRDLVQVDLVLDGLPIRIVDTAGLRESSDPIEQEGVRRAREQAARSDLVLVLEEDGGAGAWAGSPMQDMLRAMLPEIETERVLRVLNKVDRSGNPAGIVPGTNGSAGAPTELRISALTGAGVDGLAQLIKSRAGYAGEGTTFTARRRHVEALHGAAAAVAAASRLLAEQAAPELVAEELRNAHLALGSIVGAVSADDLLGEIFARFCIGK